MRAGEGAEGLTAPGTAAVPRRRGTEPAGALRLVAAPFPQLERGVAGLVRLGRAIPGGGNFMRVSEVMASDVSVVAPNTTIDAAAQMMADLDVDALPVGEPEGALAGIITGRDILLRVVAPRRDPRTTRVAEAMSAGVLCCAPEDDSQDVLREMERRQVRQMPVLDGEGRIVGLVTRAVLETESRMTAARQG